MTCLLSTTIQDAVSKGKSIDVILRYLKIKYRMSTTKEVIYNRTGFV